MSATDEAAQEHLWERIADAVTELGDKATRHEVWEHLKKSIPDINFSTVTAQLNSLSVNSPGRTSYHPGKHPRRSDSGNRYDRLFKVGRGTGTYYVPYKPSEHGVWEIYADPSASSTNKTSIRQISDVGFTAQSALDYLESRYPQSDSGTSHISAFRNSRGRELAFDPGKDPLRKTVLQVFVDASPDGFQSEDITEYPADRARNHHLAAHAPSLAAGNRAFAVRIDSLDALRRLADWYEAKTPNQNKPTRNVDDQPMPKHTQMPPPTNKILFGPPGTGKTYKTINEALRILDPEFLNANSGEGKRKILKQRFDELLDQGRVQFVTFHQSFSYEDFVEGIRASATGNSAIQYKVEPGIFRELCDAARYGERSDSPESLEFEGRRVWKISLGAKDKESHIFDECMKKGRALIGFGRGVDFSGVATKSDVEARLIQARPDTPVKAHELSQLATFIVEVKKGDLVVATYGNKKFRAIGEVTGDYEYIHRTSDRDYPQSRNVQWLAKLSSPLPVDEIYKKQFVPSTIYELDAESVRWDRLPALLSPENSSQPSSEPYVLIIDEINRGNVSRIFGELITLIEPSKRLGADEELSVTLPYSKTEFSVPQNVHLIGTMNTADRSLATIDIALRRRFEFEELMPDTKALHGIEIDGIPVDRLLATINRRIEVLLGRDFMIGHAYFMPLREQPTMNGLAEVFRRKVLPLLQEYFFEDWSKIAQVLNDHRKPEQFRFLQQDNGNLVELFGTDVDLPGAERRWKINPKAFGQPEAYQWIIGPIQGAA